MLVECYVPGVKTTGTLVVIVLILGTSWACTREASREARPVLARVNGEPIYGDEFREELQRIEIKSTDGLPVPDTLKIQAKALLNDWVQRKLLLQAVKTSHLMIGIDEIESAYLRVRNGWRPKGFEETALERELSVSDIKSELRNQLLIQMYFRDVVFSRIAIRDEDIATYLEKSPDMLAFPERVRARQIVVKTEEEAKNIARELKKGMPFTEAAMKYSLGPEARNGGDLGFFASGEMPRIFDEICFDLPLGALSPVVASDYGFHLFMVVERQKAAERPEEEVREEVEAILRQGAEELAQEKALKELWEKATLELPTEKELDEFL
jgi:hypothetical protein